MTTINLTNMKNETVTIYSNTEFTVTKWTGDIQMDDTMYLPMKDVVELLNDIEESRTRSAVEMKVAVCLNGIGIALSNFYGSMDEQGQDQPVQLPTMRKNGNMANLTNTNTYHFINNDMTTTDVVARTEEEAFANPNVQVGAALVSTQPNQPTEENTMTNDYIGDIAGYQDASQDDDQWKDQMMMDMEQVELDNANNPYIEFNQPTPFARKSILSMIVPSYLRKREAEGKIQLPLNAKSVAKTSVVLRGMVDGLLSFATAGRYITREEALVALSNECTKAAKQNSRWGVIKWTAEQALDMAETLELINDDFTYTDKFIDMCTAKDTSYPHIEAQERVQPFVKNNTRACKAVKQACGILYEEKYTSNMDMFQLVSWIDNTWTNGRCDTYNMQTRKRVKNLLQSTKYVRQGIEHMATAELMSQYDADNRGRLYHMACAGANPQASDEERSYYSLVDCGAGITKEHPSFQVFIDEVKDIGGGFAGDKMLQSIAANPSEFLIKHLVAETTRTKKIEWNGDMVDVAGKPFTMVRLAWDWKGFKDTGVLHSSIGFGEDAKNSGTQYLAICAGSKDMAMRTGLTSAPQAEWLADPYERSAEVLNEMLSKDDQFKSFAGMITRKWIKTPYMAVQYGGGVAALTGSKDYMNNLEDMGFNITIVKAVQRIAKMTVDAIKIALGKQITTLIENMQNAVEHALWVKAGSKFMTDAQGDVMYDEDGNPIKILAEHLTYKHIDGFMVDHRTKPVDTVCNSFNINMGGGENGTKIADFGPKDGTYNISAKRPTGEEYVRTFVVNFIQGLDALVARHVIIKCREAGLKGINSIHDCFRTNLEDSHKLHNVIADAYKYIFIENDVVAHLSAQLESKYGKGIKPTPFAETTVTEEILYSENAYFFCQ